MRCACSALSLSWRRCLPAPGLNLLTPPFGTAFIVRIASKIDAQAGKARARRRGEFVRSDCAGAGELPRFAVAVEIGRHESLEWLGLYPKVAQIRPPATACGETILSVRNNSTWSLVS